MIILKWLRVLLKLAQICLNLHFSSTRNAKIETFLCQSEIVENLKVTPFVILDGQKNKAFIMIFFRFQFDLILRLSTALNF